MVQVEDFVDVVDSIGWRQSRMMFVLCGKLHINSVIIVQLTPELLCPRNHFIQVGGLYVQLLSDPFCYNQVIWDVIGEESALRIKDSSIVLSLDCWYLHQSKMTTISERSLDAGVLASVSQPLKVKIGQHVHEWSIWKVLSHCCSYGTVIIVNVCQDLR